MKLLETFVYNYNPFSLSSYDDEKKQYDAEHPKKDAKEDPFFKIKSTNSDTCSGDIFDTNCHKGLKIGIIVVVITTILFTLLFVWYVLQKISFSAQKVENIRPQQVQQTTQVRQVRQVQQVQQPSLTEPVEQKSDDFFGRLFGNKPLPKRPEKESFHKRFFM